MLIAYKPKFHLLGSDNEPELVLGVSGNGSLSLMTKSFRVTYDDGVASVHLARSLTPAQMRTLGNELIAASDELEKQHEEWHTVCRTTVTKTGEVVNVVMAKVK